MNPFEQLLKELGLLMDLPLKVDAHGSCLLDFFNGLTVQIDLVEDGERILVGSQVAQINPGNFRASVFEEALKHNGKMGPSKGIFAFSGKNNTLILFHYLLLKNLNGQKLLLFLEGYLAILKVWHEDLARGAIPKAAEETAQASGIFGLKN